MNNYQQYDPYNSNANYSNNTNGAVFGTGGGTGQRPSGLTPFGGGGGNVDASSDPTYMNQQSARSSSNNNSTGSVRKSSGILPKPILEKLDDLIDRLNLSSGYSLPKNSRANGNSGGGAVSDKAGDKIMGTPPVRIICIGTNEGIPLSRSYGTSQYSSNLSEEMLCSLETIWNTTPSSVTPQVMTSSIAHQRQREQQSNNTTQPSKTSSNSSSYQPPHPLLHHIGMGPVLKSTTIYYENCIFIQLHVAPLVVTIITSPQFTNVGYIKSFAFPILKELLEPIRSLVLQQRIDLSMALASSNVNVNGDTSMVQGGHLGLPIGSNNVGNGSNGNQLDAYL